MTEEVLRPSHATAWKEPARLIMLGLGWLTLAALILIGVTVAEVMHHPQTFRGTLATVFDTIERQIVTSFDARVTVGQRQDFEDSYRTFRAAWLSGKIRANALETCRRGFFAALQKESLTPEDVVSLTRLLRTLTTGVSPSVVPETAPPSYSI